MTSTVASWALSANGGVDPLGTSGFMAGFGIAEIGAATVFAALLSFVLLRRLLQAGGA